MKGSLRQGFKESKSQSVFLGYADEAVTSSVGDRQSSVDKRRPSAQTRTTQFAETKRSRKGDGFGNRVRRGVCSRAHTPVRVCAHACTHVPRRRVLGVLCLKKIANKKGEADNRGKEMEPRS